MTPHVWETAPPPAKPPFSQSSAHWLAKNHNCSRGTMELSASSMWPGGLWWWWGGGFQALWCGYNVTERAGGTRWGRCFPGGGAFGDTLPLPDTTPSLTGPMTSLWWRPSPHVRQRRLRWFNCCDAIRLFVIWRPSKLEQSFGIDWCDVVNTFKKS